ncbi:MAG TPA: LPS export ABC transporter permease LptG [Burkholderiaceae bacterium]|nr:LPS export ABC transporter permease LptG [Burkholderiaceae bacterium]
MKVLQKYFTAEILRAVVFVLAAFLALFAFFDLMSELKSVGRGGYQLQHAFLYVLMSVPGYIYELMPIAALIGTIWALAQLASQSEFTIMRVSSMSTLWAAGALFKIGLLFVVATFLFGEIISPLTSDMAEKMKLQARGTSISQQFRSGMWAKDVIRERGVTGAASGSRFINVRDVRTDGELRGVKLYEFDNDFHLTALIIAERANYRGARTWRLTNVSETRFPNIAISQGTLLSDPGEAISSRTVPSRDLASEITPDILSVLFADPNHMSAYDLMAYIKHLAENKQHTERYEIAFWKKITYPFAALVMMALALPFAYLHVRAGGVSLKIFIGIMIGVSFQLLNSLLSHLALLNTWPAPATAIMPSAFFLLLAIVALRWVEKH